jgi:hypothetical protein
MRSDIRILDRFICFIRSCFRIRSGKKIPGMNKIDPVIIELSRIPKFRKDLAEEYFKEEKTFNRMLKREGIVLPKGKICPDDLIRIYLKFGIPKNSK